MSFPSRYGLENKVVGMTLLGAFFSVSFLLTEPQAIPEGPPCPPREPPPSPAPSPTSGPRGPPEQQGLCQQQPQPTTRLPQDQGPGRCPPSRCVTAQSSSRVPPLPPANSQTGSPLGAHLTYMGAGVASMLAAAGPEREDVGTLRGADGLRKSRERRCSFQAFLQLSGSRPGLRIKELQV